MRTTVTLDPEVEALINAAMRERGITFKQAVNDAVRAAFSPQSSTPFHQRTFAMGFLPETNYDRALGVAAAIEEQELLRNLALGQ